MDDRAMDEIAQLAVRVVGDAQNAKEAALGEQNLPVEAGDRVNWPATIAASPVAKRSGRLAKLRHQTIEQPKMKIVKYVARLVMPSAQSRV